MSTLAEILEAHGRSGDGPRGILKLSERQAIKYFLNAYGNLLDAYSEHLLAVGFRRSQNGIVAVLDGVDIRTVNGGSHRPRGKMQVMAFRALNGWMLWTPDGLALVDEAASDSLAVKQFELKE